MNRKLTTTGTAGLLVLALAGAQGGCGSSGGSKPKATPTSPYSTRISVDGEPGATHQCQMVLKLLQPQYKQITATLDVTCNTPLMAATSSLVIQGRPLGTDNTHWDNVDDPRVSYDTDIALTYTVPCITGIDYQASAAIDVVFTDGAEKHSTDTAGPKYYNSSECSGKQ